MNVQTATSQVLPSDVKVGDMIGDFGFLVVDEIMVDGPSAYEVRLHGPANYVFICNSVYDGAPTYTVPSDQLLTKVNN